MHTDEGRIVEPPQLVSSANEDYRRLADSTTVESDDHAPSQSSAAPGREWGHLHNLVKVGSGGFSEVFRAWDTRLQREVALKLFWESASQGSEVDCLGSREARLLARIRHPNVVTVHGVDYISGRLGLWMEFIHGRTLASLLLDLGPLSALEAVLIGLDVCRAVAAVHGSGLLHLDIKAQNIMREEGGRIVLMDFGVSQDLPKPSLVLRERKLSGTPLYMAPELLRGEKATVQSDIYAIGILLYHLVTVSYPIHGGSLSELRAAHRRGESKLLRDQRYDLPEAFLQSIERALAAEAAERFATVGHMLKALSACLVIEVHDGDRVSAKPAPKKVRR